MQELEKRLTKQLLQNNKVKLMNVSRWCIPVQSIKVEFQPVLRVKMDVLMKMMLIAFQKAEINNASELSELFIVEQLFIEDLLNNLLRTGLIEQTDSYFKLTTKGEKQLQEGVFEEQQELAVQELLFSTSHAAFLKGNLDNATEFDELPELYRYAQEELGDALEFESAKVIEALEVVREPAGEAEMQTVISEIMSIDKLQINDIPCLEFILYNNESDTLYVRVWNTLLNQWDEILEHQLIENEIVTWREAYLT